MRRLLAGSCLLLLACGGGESPSPVAGDSAKLEADPPEAARETVAERDAGLEEQRDPPTAHWDVVDMLREAAAQPQHASDGGGRAWLEQREGDAERARVGVPGRFTLVYEVGPLGIATGGQIHFQVSPFWGWSTPQVEAPDAPGYTLVEPLVDDIELDVGTLGQQLLGMEVTGRPLVAGDRIRITFGAGSLGAFPDRYAERGSRFWFAVDGDGDGIRAFLPDSPSIDVLAGAPATLVLRTPSVVRPGERFEATLAVLDAAGSAGVEIEGVVTLEPLAGLAFPDRVTLASGAGGHARFEIEAREPGLYRLRAVGPEGLEAESNPMLVSADGPRVLWADLHGHSNLSDGTGSVEDYYSYARDIAGLDVAALTDHDHWGILPLDGHPEMWDEIKRVTKAFNEPGRFVTLLGYEWTSWIHGHRHVLYFEDDGIVVSSLPEETESPLDLWKALEGRPALTFAHHSAGGPIATNWEIPPDPRFEPVTEIVSVHGSSEALDSPRVIYGPVPGNFVRDELDRGYRLGFIGSGDSHDGHPGLAHLASPSGGLAAILSDDLTREGILAALRERRTYATNGARILLRFAVGAAPMGSLLRAAEIGASQDLFVSAVAPEPLERVDLIRSGKIVDSVAVEGRREVALQRTVENLRPGEYLYVRAVQVDGGAAWSSPIFVE